MFEWLGRVSYQRRWLVLAGTLVFVAIAGVCGVSVFDRLKAGGFDDPNAESVRARVLLAEEFGAGPPDLVMLVTATGGVDSPAARASGLALTREVAAEPGVAQVVSFWTTPNPRLSDSHGDKALVLIGLAGDEEAVEQVGCEVATQAQSYARGPLAPSPAL